MRHCIICNHLIKTSFQPLWMRDLYIRFRTFRKRSASIISERGHLATAHSRKLVTTTFSNSRDGRLRELRLYLLFSVFGNQMKHVGFDGIPIKVIRQSAGRHWLVALSSFLLHYTAVIGEYFQSYLVLLLSFKQLTVHLLTQHINSPYCMNVMHIVLSYYGMEKLPSVASRWKHVT